MSMSTAEALERDAGERLVDAPSNPLKPRRWERIYWNVLVLGSLFAFACAMFSYGVGEGTHAISVAGAEVGVENLGEKLQKAAFIVMVTLAPGYLTMVANMALKTMRVDGRALPNPTAWLLAVQAVGMIAVTVVSIDVSVYSDMVFEGIAGGTAGTMLAVLQAFAGGDDAEG